MSVFISSKTSHCVVINGNGSVIVQTKRSSPVGRQNDATKQCQRATTEHTRCEAAKHFKPLNCHCLGLTKVQHFKEVVKNKFARDMKANDAV